MTLNDAVRAYVTDAPDWQATGNAMAVLMTTPQEWVDPFLFTKLGWDHHRELEDTPIGDRIAAITQTPEGQDALSHLSAELAVGRWDAWPPLRRQGGAVALRADLAQHGIIPAGAITP
jgi:hypothetical protein